MFLNMMILMFVACSTTFNHKRAVFIFFAFKHLHVTSFSCHTETHSTMLSVKASPGNKELYTIIPTCDIKASLARECFSDFSLWFVHSNVAPDTDVGFGKLCQRCSNWDKLTTVVFCLLQGQITLMDAPVFKAIQPEVRCSWICREEGESQLLYLGAVIFGGWVGGGEWAALTRAPTQSHTSA